MQAYRKKTGLRQADSGETLQQAIPFPIKYYNVVSKTQPSRCKRILFLLINLIFTAAVKNLSALIRSSILVHKKPLQILQLPEKKISCRFIHCKKNKPGFSPHVLWTMFEPQDHYDFQYPGGPPVPPYDAAGWTL